jgi:hypothetical protein
MIATISKSKRRTRIVLYYPTLLLWIVGIFVGFVTGPIIYGFKLGLRESKKLWEFPNEFTDT